MKFRFLSVLSLVGLLALAACNNEQPASSPQINTQPPTLLIPVLPPGSNPGRVPNPNPILRAFEEQFVQIPAGFLPGHIAVATFEADRYPVTRQFWNEIMGGKPVHAPETQEEWIAQPRVPVTHVNWENEDNTPAEVQDFLVALNLRFADSGCIYDLPTDHQLWYSIRGDVTGTNEDRFSTGVTNANVNQYVTHWENADTDGTGARSIQPIGLKRLNAFGIELGNVWQMSKELYYDGNQPEFGRSMRGGSWRIVVGVVASGSRFRAGAGNRYDDMGFALVRTCP